MRVSSYIKVYIFNQMYINEKNIKNNGDLMPWLSESKAFPNRNCPCMKEDPLPTICTLCGADRGPFNWYDEEESLQK